VAQIRRPTHERRTEIADAALGIIASDGIAALTLAGVAERLGISAAALFRHYDSREQILAAVAARVEERVTRFPPPSLPPLDRLRAFVDARTRAFGEDSGLARLLFSEQFSLALPPAARAPLRRIVRRTRAFVVRALKDGMAAGAIRHDVGADALATIVMGTVQALSFFSAGAHKPPAAGVWTTLETLLQPRGEP
jgi:AcrR family transcriptional regulator